MPSKNRITFSSRPTGLLKTHNPEQHIYVWTYEMSSTWWSLKYYQIHLKQSLRELKSKMLQYLLIVTLIVKKKCEEQEINGLEIIYSCCFGLGFGSEFSVRSWRSFFRKSFGFTFEKNAINVIANHAGHTSSTHIRKGNHTNRTIGGK